MPVFTLREYHQKLERLFQEEFYEEVIGHSTYILKHYPKNVDTYRWLGRALLKTQKLDQASEVFRRILTADPFDYQSHRGLSEIYEAQQNIESAIWHIERIFDAYPNEPEVVNNLRRLYLLRDGKEPDKIPLTRAGLARQYMSGQLHDQAAAELQNALQDDPQRHDLRLMLAQALYAGNHEAEAGRTALQVLESLPDNLDANYLLAQLWIEHKRPQDAQPFLEHLEQLSPYDALALITNDPTTDSKTYSVEELDWHAKRTRDLATQMPDWMREFDGDAPAARSGPVEAVPDWIERGTGLAPQAPIAAPTPTEDIEDWFSNIEKGPSSEVAFALDATPSSAGAAVPFGLDIDSDMPDDLPLPDDWMAESERPTVLESLTLPDSLDELSLPTEDWLADDTVPELPNLAANLDLDGLSLPAEDWMNNFGDELPLPEESFELGDLPLPAEDWLHSSDDPDAHHVAGQTLPVPDEDWLAQMQGESLGFDAAAETLPTLDDSDWMGLIETDLPRAIELEDANLDWQEEPQLALEVDEAELDWQEEPPTLPQPSNLILPATDDLPELEEAELPLQLESSDWMAELGDLDGATLEDIPTWETNLNTPPLAEIPSDTILAAEFGDGIDLPELESIEFMEGDTLPFSDSTPQAQVVSDAIEDEDALMNTANLPDDSDWMSSFESLESASAEDNFDLEPNDDDWMATFGNAEAQADDQPLADNDWMASFGSAENEPQPELDLPADNNWMMSFGSAEPEPQVESNLDWMSQGDSDQPAEADWMTSFGSAEAEPQAESDLGWMSQGDSDQPAADADWMTSFGSAEAEPQAENDLGWMTSFGSVEAEPQVESNLDWMSQGDSDQPADDADWMTPFGSVEAEPQAETDLGWMTSFGSTEAEPQAESNLDWMSQGDSDQPADDANWMTSFGSAEAEPQAETDLGWMSQGDSDQPADDADWMTSFGNAEAEPQAESNLDWMSQGDSDQPAEADWMTSFGSAEAEPQAETDLGWMSQGDSDQPADDADWMTSFGNAEAEPQAESNLDWMSQGDSDQPAEADWMTSFGNAEAEPQAESNLDWMSQGDSDQPAADADWMTSFGSAEPEPQAESDPGWMSQGDSDQPAADANWMTSFGSAEAEPQAETDLGWMSQGDSDQPAANADWMTSFGSAELEPQAELDWMSQSDSDQPADDADWMTSFGSADTEPQAESNLDWMSQGDSDQPADDADWMTSFGSADTEPQAESNLDWMSQGDSDQPADEANWMTSFGSAEPEPQTELDWMSQSDSDQPAESDGMSQDDSGQPAQGDWMAFSEQEAKSEPIWGQEEIAEDAMQWEASSEAVSYEPPAMNVGADAQNILQQTIDEHEQPDWLSDLTKEIDVSQHQPEAITPLSQTSEPTGDTAAATPDWLLGDDDFGFEEEPESPAWLQQSAPPPPDLLPEDDVPSWMSAFGEEEISTVAQDPVLTDNSNDIEDSPTEESEDFDFIYNFDMKPAWMRGQTDSDSESQGFTPPWMR